MHDILEDDSRQRDLIATALPWAVAVIDDVDPDGAMSELLAASVAYSALKRAAARWEPTRAEWPVWAVTAMRGDLEKTLRSGQTEHRAERIAAAIYGDER